MHNIFQKKKKIESKHSAVVGQQPGFEFPLFLVRQNPVLINPLDTHLPVISFVLQIQEIQAVVLSR